MKKIAAARLDNSYDQNQKIEFFDNATANIKGEIEFDTNESMLNFIARSKHLHTGVHIHSIQWYSKKHEKLFNTIENRYN